MQIDTWIALVCVFGFVICWYWYRALQMMFMADLLIRRYAARITEAFNHGRVSMRDLEEYAKAKRMRKNAWKWGIGAYKRKRLGAQKDRAWRKAQKTMVEHQVEVADKALAERDEK